jgi:hypothetical protein
MNEFSKMLDLSCWNLGVSDRQLHDRPPWLVVDIAGYPVRYVVGDVVPWLFVQDITEHIGSPDPLKDMSEGVRIGLSYIENGAVLTIGLVQNWMAPRTGRNRKEWTSHKLCIALRKSWVPKKGTDWYYEFPAPHKPDL